MERGVGGLKGVVEPPAKRVVAGAGGGMPEEGGDLSGDVGGGEKECGGWGGREREWGGED